MLSNIIDSVVAKEAQEESEQKLESMPPKRILLRHVTTPEQKWMTEIGGMLFDVFSNTERQRAKAFDEEFLNDQRHERKMVMDTSRVTAEYKAAKAKESERERRSRNYRESATSILVSVPLDLNTDDISSCPLGYMVTYITFINSTTLWWSYYFWFGRLSATFELNYLSD